MTTSGQIRLEQRALFKGKQVFETREDDTIIVTTQTRFSLNQYSLPLAAIDPDPSRIKRYPKQWVAAACFFGLFSIFWLYVLVKFSDATDYVGYAVCLTFFSVLFATACYQLKKQNQDSLIFYSKANGQPIFSLWYARPSMKCFDEFVSALTSRVRLVCDGAKLPTTGNVVEEIRQLKKLKDEGILTDAEFESSKKKLLDSLGGQKPLGFGAS